MHARLGAKLTREVQGRNNENDNIKTPNLEKRDFPCKETTICFTVLMHSLLSLLGSVMDLLRFHKFTVGNTWTYEYGNPEEEKHFRNLVRLSPLHNVPDSNSIERFPATLLKTGDQHT